MLPIDNFETKFADLIVMANSYFQFRKFTVWQDKCAMKVGTDGVLLGAWTNASGNLNILDVGAGTGLLSLMLAQRTTGYIDSVEIDMQAAEQAEENYEKSIWHSRIKMYKLSIQEFYKVYNKTYDLIVSNPPFFMEGIKAPDNRRALARHSDTLSLTELFRISKDLLSENGRLSIIIPSSKRSSFIEGSMENELHLSRQTEVKPNRNKSPHRLLLEVSKIPVKECEYNQIIIEDNLRHVYTEEYISLTKDYYLSF